MGSIQVFPRRPPAAAPARGWTDSVSTSAPLEVRDARLEDYGAIRPLVKMTLRQFEDRRAAFPEGQQVAARDGEIVGFASALTLKWDQYGIDHHWKEITGDGHFTTHDPAGGTLYGVDLAVDPERGGFAAARALLQARRRLCRRRNLCRVIAPVRLAGYAALLREMPPERYVMRVIWGDLEDPWLRFHMSIGMQYCGVVHGYLPDDTASGGHAALLAWLNPLHSPLGPPARIQRDRSRKCA